jgi:hypothetical protein
MITSVLLGSFFSKPGRSCRIATYSFAIRTNLERNTAVLLYVIANHYVKFSPSVRHSPSVLSIGPLDQLLSGRPSLGVKPYYTLIHVTQDTHGVWWKKRLFDAEVCAPSLRVERMALYEVDSSTRESILPAAASPRIMRGRRGFKVSENQCYPKYGLVNL